MESKAPSTCRLCQIPLASPSEWRQHAKSEEHVYKLRLRVAEPGAVVSPPKRLQSGTTQPSNIQEPEVSIDSYSDDDDFDANEEGPLANLELDPTRCLFCSNTSIDLNTNLTHISKAHNFIIPHLSDLKVELEVIIEYLQLIIFGYNECIACATRSNTTEGIQQHMLAKGHCRFEITPDVAEEFYDLPPVEYTIVEESLRLSSGKIVRSQKSRGGSRPQGASASAASSSKAPRQSSTERELEATAANLTALPHPQTQLSPTPNIPPAPSTQLSRLTKGDQRSLAHLSEPQVRSLIAASARHVEQFRRGQKQGRLKVGKSENFTLMGNFRMDTSKRFRGPWG